MKVFKNGLLTGLVLQMAIGPVFFFIINLVLQKSTTDGFAGVIGVTLADYLYITFAILGVGKILENKRIKKTFAFISSIVLVIFGIMIINGISNITNNNVDIKSINTFSSFLSVFLLTLSSPLTIIMWTGIFASKTIEYNYTKKQLLIFGLSTGLATFIFMGLTVIVVSLIRNTIPILIIKILNIIVGSLLISYGTLRFIKSIKK